MFRALALLLSSVCWMSQAIGQTLPPTREADAPAIPKVKIPTFTKPEIPKIKKPDIPVIVKPIIPSAAVSGDYSMDDLDKVRKVANEDRVRIQRDSDRGAAAGHLLDLVPWFSGVFGMIGGAGAGAISGKIGPVLRGGAGMAVDNTVDAFHGRLLYGNGSDRSSMHVLGNPRLTGSSVDAKYCAVFPADCR